MIVLCAATEMEVNSVLEKRSVRFGDLPQWNALQWARTWNGMLFAVTGVGIPLTMARLAALMAKEIPDLLFNFGIAGAYPDSGLGIGDVVAAESETFGDLGMETPGPERFLSLRDTPWAGPEYKEAILLTTEPFKDAAVEIGKGCTINTCTGREETGKLRREMFGVDFESMEGAAVALTGRLNGIPACEIRAISNIASTRDMRPENIAKALGNLGVYMDGWLAKQVKGGLA